MIHHRIVDAKARQLSLDENNIEFQKEYLAAQNELVGVQAQVAGFRSEQVMNEMVVQLKLHKAQHTVHIV